MKTITCTREELEKDPKLQKEVSHRTLNVTRKKNDDGTVTELLNFGGYTESMIRKAKLLKKKPSELTKTEISTPFRQMQVELAKKSKSSK